MFLLNSRRTRFTAAPSSCKLYRGDPSPEVTGLICRVPERAFSQAPLDYLLVYLCRFEVRFPSILLRGFSWQRGISSFQPYGLLLCVSALMSLTDLPTKTALHASSPIAIGGLLILLRHPIVITNGWEFRNINRMSIGYAFRPRLRDRLTLSGLTFLRKP